MSSMNRWVVLWTIVLSVLRNKDSDYPFSISSLVPARDNERKLRLLLEKQDMIVSNSKGRNTHPTCQLSLSIRNSRCPHLVPQLYIKQYGGNSSTIPLHCLKQELYMRAINLNIALLRLYFCADLCIAINIESSFILQFIGLGL